MSEQYLLFLDTETTGLPTSWNRPYARPRHWPAIAQLGWQVFTVEGQLIRQDQAYLRVPPGRMTAAAEAVHGLTEAFLAQHGQAPAAVLARLLADLERYQPRVVGHFLRLDFHVIGAALAGAGLPNPLPGLPQFCTMRITQDARLGSPGRQLRLQELHQELFREALARQHDAAVDAAATARCFFELRRRGLIPAGVLTGQPRLTEPGREQDSGRGRFGLGWLLLMVVALLLGLYWFGNG
ncbi:3'-5' exonuclease [Hymenobacter sp. NST-14]|uniref:3'-5' exonuclease n=1 Tax=Hymenobacter piscis TaxID=2839984 RepID=UPI001C02058F|nr:3'-5' exonuclease [Hymenobacter piscis]MBT9393728.1 3'-5' exonuclease [Hymenobacter piscis]